MPAVNDELLEEVKPEVNILKACTDMETSQVFK